MSKTILITLFGFAEHDFHSCITAEAPSWGSIGIKLSDKYLGYFVGPGRGNLSWLVPLQKFRELCVIWRNIGPGMLHSIKAFKVHIFSVLLFVLQLERLPSGFTATFTKGISALFPGPRGWITLGCLAHLASLHFPDQINDPQAVSIAARLRVSLFENIKCGGLGIAETFLCSKYVMLQEQRSIAVG